MNLDLHMARPDERVVMRVFSGLCVGGYGRGRVGGYERRGLREWVGGLSAHEP